jgi:hypothetical protein
VPGILAGFRGKVFSKRQIPFNERGFTMGNFSNEDLGYFYVICSKCQFSGQVIEDKSRVSCPTCGSVEVSLKALDETQCQDGL